MQTSTNLHIPRPNIHPAEGVSDTPVDLPQLFHDRDAILDLLCRIQRGALSGRPASHHDDATQPPSQLYVVTDQADSPRLDWDSVDDGWVTLWNGGGRYATAIGDGAATTYLVNHNLNTRDVSVTVRQAGAPYRRVEADIAMDTVNRVSVSFAAAPALNAYQVIVKA